MSDWLTSDTMWPHSWGREWRKNSHCIVVSRLVHTRSFVDKQNMHPMEILGMYSAKGNILHIYIEQINSFQMLKHTHLETHFTPQIDLLDFTYWYIHTPETLTLTGDWAFGAVTHAVTTCRHLVLGLRKNRTDRAIKHLQPAGVIQEQPWEPG